MLKIQSVTKSYTTDNEEIVALRPITFEVENKEFFSIVGPSGCGKSTLLRVIAGLTEPSTGKLVWSKTPKISFVFQNFALFPYLTVFDNINFGLKMAGIPIKKSRPAVEELIEEMNLGGFGNKHPKELSGGMKQRVGLARALATNPNLLLLDEPFSSLDEFTSESLRNLLLNIWRKREITIIMVTHLIREALVLSDRIAAMTSPPGHIDHIFINHLSRPRNTRDVEFYDLEDQIKKLFKD